MFEQIEKCNYSLDFFTQILMDTFTTTGCEISAGISVILTTVLSVPCGMSTSLLGGAVIITGEGVIRAAGVVPAPGTPPAAGVVPAVGGIPPEGCKKTSLYISENQMTKLKCVCISGQAIAIYVQTCALKASGEFMTNGE